MSSFCLHCFPTKRTGHAALRIEYYADKMAKWISLPEVTNGDRLWTSMLRGAEKIGLIKFVPNPPESAFSNRALIFLREAERRALDVRALSVAGKFIDEFVLTYNGKKYFYESIPLTILSKSDELDQRDKRVVRDFLSSRGFPVAAGGLFTDPKAAFDAGRRIGYPLMAKPNAGSRSNHAVGPVHTDEELKNAIAIASAYRPDIIVERYIPGRLYRASVLGQERLFFCEKVRANVVGDGCSTIRDLIAQKNADPRRGQAGAAGFSLHHIPVDDDLAANLSVQKLTLDSIPSAGERILLHSKNVVSLGSDVITRTNDLHPDNRELFLNVARAVNTDLIGIDFICPDASRSYRDQECAIIETNSLPHLDLHAFPSEGEPEPIAAAAWDIVLSRIST